VNTYYAPGGTTATPGIISNFVGNPNGKWETKKSTNIGFDALLFKGNTEISFDWYNDKTTDLLFPLRQSALGGGAVNSNPAYYNVASMKNTGIDLMISQRAKIGSVLLRGSLAFTTYKNQITGIAEGISFFEAGSVGRINTPLVRNAVGVPISSYYGYKVLGFFADATDVSKSPTQDGAAPGRFKYADLNGRDANGQLTGAPDGKIDNDDRTFLGSPNPEFTYGINLSAEWKGFDVAAFFYGVQGRCLLVSVAAESRVACCDNRLAPLRRDAQPAERVVCVRDNRAWPDARRHEAQRERLAPRPRHTDIHLQQWRVRALFASDALARSYATRAAALQA
jgi:hypothetical protein